MEEREGSRERTKSGNAGERKRGKRERERERERRKKNRCIEALTNYPGARCEGRGGVKKRERKTKSKKTVASKR
jgi:hypothetical protein